MATIKLKSSNSAGNVPSSLEPGEVAICTRDGNWFYGNAGSTVKNDFMFGQVKVTGVTSGETIHGMTLSARTGGVYGTLQTAAQPNITSVGTLTALSVDGEELSLNATTAFNIDNSNTEGGITIGTNTSGVPISIGHATSETTVNDNLTVTGNLTSAGFVGTQHIVRNSAFYVNDNPFVQNSLYFGHNTGSQPMNFNDPQAVGGTISSVSSFTIVEDDMGQGIILPCDISKVEVQCSLRPNLGDGDDFSIVMYTGIRSDDSNTDLTLTKVAIAQTTFNASVYTTNDLTYTGDLNKGTMIYVGVGSEDATDAKNARGIMNITVTQR